MQEPSPPTEDAPERRRDAGPADSAAPDTPLQYMKGVGPHRAKLLAKIGIATYEDLARHLPRTHEDRRHPTAIGDLEPEMHATVRGKVVRVVSRTIRGRRGRRSVVTVTVDDGTGTLDAEFWQQPFRARQLAEGREAFLSGRVTWDLGGPKMTSPDVETSMDKDDGAQLHADRIVPIHPLTKSFSAQLMRVLVHRALEAVADDLVDPIPEGLRRERDLAPLAASLREAHFPTSEESRHAALVRLKYEELFLFEVALAIRRRKQGMAEKPHRIRIDERIDARIRSRLPFTLTPAQDRVVKEIAADLATPTPMNRLLQGDVGSGKTAVAVYALLATVASGLQAALLAPTEILAEQHRTTLERYLAGSRVEVALIAGGGKARARREVRRRAAEGELDIAVGTHALFTESVSFDRLALVIVDEQHKFGVMQRKTLRDKGLQPDLLVMSATPIPRTLTMTLYGDLDLSILDGAPPGRQPIDTVVCREGDRRAAYDWIRREIRAGRRAYVVVPRVEHDDESELTSVEEHVTKLRESVFPDIPVAALHGKMPAAEKEEVMQAFRDGATPILVSTTVIEVGVDVPEATVLVVENAERFGLAQLHQLRGRVGRGSHPSRVILFHDAATGTARQRLAVMERTTDGFEIAEEDLRIRGPGEVLGTKQHGLPEFQVADIVEDAPLLRTAREDAFALIARDPTLTGEGACVLEALWRRHGELLTGIA